MDLEASIPAIEIIKELEELRLEAYQDGDSISIGYGHSNTSGGEQFELGDTITEEKANELLAKDLEEIQRIVNQRLKNYGITFNQKQFDVMVIGTYNRPGKLSSKKFYDALLLDNEDEVAEIWNTSITDEDRKNFPGLINRLNVELGALNPDRGIPVPEEGFDPSPTPSTTTTTMPEQDEEIDTTTRSEGVTNMFGTPPQDLSMKANRFYDLSLNLMEKQVNKQRKEKGLRPVRKKARPIVIKDKEFFEEAFKILGGK